MKNLILTTIVFMIVVACVGEPTKSSGGRVARTASALLSGYDRVVVATNLSSPAWGNGHCDLDQDGREDFYVVPEAGEIDAYLQLVPGVWTKVIVGQGGTQSGSACKDLNRDGFPDIVTAEAWFKNQGGQSFQKIPFTIPGVTLGDHDVEISDVDGNGLQDPTMRGEGSDEVDVLLQGPIGTFNAVRLHPNQPLQGSQAWNGLKVVDLNDDGRLDVVVAGIAMLQPCSGIADGANWPRLEYEVGWNSEATLASADVNRDGRPDMIHGTSEGQGPLWWFENPGDSILTAGHWTSHPIETADLFQNHMSGGDWALDADHDGDADVFVSEYVQNGRQLLYRNDGAGFAQVVLGNDGLHEGFVADVNRDGYADLCGVDYGRAIFVCYVSRVVPTCGQNGSGGSGDGSSTNGGSLAGGAAGSSGTTQGGSSSGGAGPGGASSGGASFGGEASGGASQGGSGNSSGSGGSGGATLLFGETSNVGSLDSNQGLLIAQKATLSQAITLRSLSFYSISPAGQLYLGVYDATGTGGNPKNLKATTAAFNVVQGWNTINVVAPIALSAGTYWLAHEPSSGSMTYPNIGGGNAIWVDKSPFAVLPTTFPTSGLSTGGFHWSEYGSGN